VGGGGEGGGGAGGGDGGGEGGGDGDGHVHVYEAPHCPHPVPSPLSLLFKKAHTWPASHGLSAA